ncbi:MAG: HEPN domain-containing protein [Thermoprotei archaeon]|nr:HEPN domain-containing protein [Thermoprotei archaeon]
MNPREEALYRLKLALDHLRRRELLLKLEDWAGAVTFFQMAIENFAKALISLFQEPSWTHDPSPQLRSIINELPMSVRDVILELVDLVHRYAPEHGRASYGEPSLGLTPADIYREEHAQEARRDALRAKEIAEGVLLKLGVKVNDNAL